MMIEETAMVHKFLPIHYNCQPLEHGVKCSSPTGMEQEVWDHLMRVLPELFPQRFVRVQDLGDNQMHQTFIIFLKGR